MNEFKWTKKLLLFFIKDIFEGILSHDFFLPLIYIFFRQKYEKGNLNEILNILIKFYGDEASEINRNTTHGVLMIPHLILKAADVTSSKVILWGLSSTQYGSFRSSSSFSSCKQKTHTHTLTLFPSPTLLCSNVFAQWAKIQIEFQTRDVSTERAPFTVSFFNTLFSFLPKILPIRFSIARAF